MHNAIRRRYTGWDKNRFIVICMENNTRVNSTFCILTTVSLICPTLFFRKTEQL